MNQFTDFLSMWTRGVFLLVSIHFFLQADSAEIAPALPHRILNMPGPSLAASLYAYKSGVLLLVAKKAFS